MAALVTVERLAWSALPSECDFIGNLKKDLLVLGLLWASCTNNSYTIHYLKGHVLNLSFCFGNNSEIANGVY